MKALPFIAAASLAFGGAASASVIPVLASVTPAGSNFQFSYEAQLSPDEGLTAGDEFVVIDFQGYVPGSISSSSPNWTASVSDALPAGLLTPPGGDNPSVPDLVFTYNGPDVDTSGGPFGGDTNYFGLTALSTLGGVTSTDFSADAINNSGRETGTTDYNVGLVGAPGSLGAAVPEPTSWALILGGVGAIGVALRLSRRLGSRPREVWEI
jgi:hypothetical protein